MTKYISKNDFLYFLNILHIPAYVSNRAFEKKFGNFQLNNISNTQLSKIF